MLGRSHVHLFAVAAGRLKEQFGDETLIKALSAASKETATAIAEGRAQTPEEQKRLERQATLFAVVPDSAAKTRLKEAMLQRAYDLLWNGNPAGCDAILEWMSSDDTRAMLDAWCGDQEDDGVKSKWYERAA